MKKTKTYNLFFLSLFLLSTTLFSFSGCSDDDEKVVGELELAEPIKIVGAKQGKISIEVNSNTNWKIGKLNENATWLKVSKTDDQSTSFSVEYEENAKIENRETEFYVVTVDGKGFQKFQFTQLGDEPLLKLEKNELDVVSRSRTHRIEIETNIPSDLIEKEIIYEGETNQAWILGLEVQDGLLVFKTERNIFDNERNATIILTLKNEDIEGADIWGELSVKQLSSQNDVPPEFKDFSYAKSLPIGEIEENISIRGNIVMSEPSDNFRPGTKTYIIQDEHNSAIVFEAMEDLTFAAYDKVDLLLDGAEMTSYTENGFNYQVIKGITKGTILAQNSDPNFAPKEMYMKDLTDDYLLSLVTLKDVEFAIPYGGYSNFHEYYLSNDAIKGYSDYATKHYPAPIMDINGDHLYMITNREVSYRRKSVPKGAGTITGIITRISDSAYGDLGKYSIRQLKEEQINMSPNKAENFSEILVEWDCAWYADKHTDGMQNLPPVTGQTGATLKKNDFRGYFLKNPGYAPFPNSIFFVDEYRGDKVGSGTAMGSSAINVNAWGTGNYWVIDNVSTLNITKPISLQIEANGTLPGPKDFAVEYSLDGEQWIRITDYTVISQISANVKDYVIAGFKMYMFKLPIELLNKSNISIRLLNTTDNSIEMKQIGSTGTSRLGHVSLKYNK